MPNDWEVLDIELAGLVGGGRKCGTPSAASLPVDWHLSATEDAVGVGGSIGAEMLVGGEISESGVLPPERCVPAAAFRLALSERGIETAITPPSPHSSRWTLGRIGAGKR